MTNHSVISFLLSYSCLLCICVRTLLSVMTLSLENGISVYHSRVHFTGAQINALQQEGDVKHTQPVNCLHFQYDRVSAEADNWAIFRYEKCLM